MQNKYVRACKGGVGFAKAAGNYGATMKPMMEIREKGFDQILWTDGVEHKYVQEIGTMNVFFVIGDKVLTPSLNDSILAGITRDSVIKLLREKGLIVEERLISVEEIKQAHRDGELKEAFGAGTAAVIAPIAELFHEGESLMLPPIETWDVSNGVKKELADIRQGRSVDSHQWMFNVC